MIRRSIRVPRDHPAPRRSSFEHSNVVGRPHRSGQKTPSGRRMAERWGGSVQVPPSVSVSSAHISRSQPSRRTASSPQQVTLLRLRPIVPALHRDSSSHSTADPAESMSVTRQPPTTRRQRQASPLAPRVHAPHTHGTLHATEYRFPAWVRTCSPSRRRSFSGLVNLHLVHQHMAPTSVPALSPMHAAIEWPLVGAEATRLVPDAHLGHG